MEEEANKNLWFTLVDTEELYQHAPCGYLSFLPDGTIVKINQTLLKWLGYQLEELLYKRKFSDMLSRGGKIHYEMFFRPIINLNGTIKELSYDLIKKDGTPLPVLVNGTAVRNDTGHLLIVNTAVIDITERKRYELELLLSKKQAEAEKKKFEFLAEQTPEIIWTANPHGYIDYVNQYFFQYFNIALETVEPGWVIQKIHPGDRKNMIRAWMKSLESGNDFSCRIRLEKTPNLFEWHMLKAIPYVDKEGMIIKWFGSCANIDEHVLAIERKDEFINIASHELRTPITSLKGYLQLLEKSDLLPKPLRLAEKALNVLNNLQLLVSSLLDVSTINSGELVLNFSKFPLEKIVLDCIEQVSYTRRSHQIEYIYDQTMTYLVYADKERITQVLINLISNAIKYSPQAQKVIVRLAANKTNSRVRVEVEDFGLGIPEAQLPFIFNRYYRVKEHENKMQGLGLGLYIIHNILLKHQSIIKVKSNVGKGSVFEFSLGMVSPH